MATRTPKAKTKETVVIPFDHTCPGQNPAHLVNLHVVAAQHSENDYPYSLTLLERVKDGNNGHEVQIELYGAGRYHEMRMSDNLHKALNKASVEKPIKITEAVYGRLEQMVTYRPSHGARGMDMKGMKMNEVFNLVGIKLQGMRTMGWIWGVDGENEYDAGTQFSGSYIV